MKKKIIIGLSIVATIILAVVLFVWIYYFVFTEKIVLTSMPATDIQEQIDVYKELGYCKKGYIDEEKEEIIICLTRHQRQKWIAVVKEDMKYMLERANELDNMEYQVSENTKELILMARQNVSFNSVGTYGIILTYDIELYQILSGEKNWGFKFILKDMDTCNVLYTADVPKERIKVYDYLWEK